MKSCAALLILWLPVVAWPAPAPAGTAAQSATRVAPIWLAAAAGSAVAPEGAMAASGAVSMDQAVKMVERRFHARVVKAETERDNGRTVYVLRLLSDSGKVWTVRVDAADGAVQ